jgi:UDP-N-acetyl-D-mannosaminuronic acid transferase (WecB/TagA/CpsF family)
MLHFIFESSKQKIDNQKKRLVIIPIGAAFDFIAKVKPQAPKFLQKYGLEWFFRLFCEPRRLFVRYLVYGTIYILLILRQKIKFMVDMQLSRF